MTTADQDYKDLSKALSYANWATLGLIIPFLGWLLAGSSLNIIRGIEETKQNARKISVVRRTAWIAIVISSISAGLWLWFYNSTQNQEPITTQSTVQSDRTPLGECMTQAAINHGNYIKDNGGYTQDNLSIADERLKQEQSVCNNNYSN